MNNRILLHVCCGVCSFWPIRKLQNEGFEVECLFYNPNIHPLEEYGRRLQAVRHSCALSGVPLHEGAYDDRQWFDAVKGFEQEREGGQRCMICYRMRLEYTKIKAGEGRFSSFATTLTVSPHKNARVINEIGRSVGAGIYKEYDFKKENGFKHTTEAARGHAVYRQKYCGCRFSYQLEEDRDRRPKEA